jgi:hypothetical protein
MKETKFLQVAVAAVIGACSLFIALALVYVRDLGPPAYALADRSEVIATAETSALLLAADPAPEEVVQPEL